MDPIPDPANSNRKPPETMAADAEPRTVAFASYMNNWLRRPVEDAPTKSEK
ncbi:MULTISPECIES: hypothetical protein [Acetobacterales]|uniref:hypothetical protein n=1 Tax=Roseomonas sp. WGS1072 TaxID=3366816 RepID=UPI003BEFBB7C